MRKAQDMAMDSPNAVRRAMKRKLDRSGWDWAIAMLLWSGSIRTVAFAATRSLVIGVLIAIIEKQVARLRQTCRQARQRPPPRPVTTVVPR